MSLQPDVTGSASFTNTDFEELSNIYASEFNKPELHDRVLVLDVLTEEWETTVAEPLIVEEEGSKIRPPESPICEESEKESSPNISSDQAKRIARKRLQGNDVPLPVNGKKPKIKLACKCESETEERGGKKTDCGESDEDSSNDENESGSETGLVENQDQLPSFSVGLTLGMVQQYRILVHSSWLAVHSSYFRSLFYSGLSESHSKEVHLKISESEGKSHLQLLEAMYRADILNDASVDELLAVLELADKYDVKFVFRKCKYVLKTKTTSVEVCEKIVHVVKVKHEMTNVEDLIATVSAYLARKFSPLDETWQKESFKHLSKFLVYYLLRSNDLNTQSENTVFHALMFWTEFNKFSLSSWLLSVVRFQLMTMDYLHNVVQIHPVATNIHNFRDHYLKGVTYHALQPDVRQLLKDKPVKRRSPDNNIVQYQWSLPKNMLNNLKGDAKLTSDVFWSCGYGMHMSLRKASSCSYVLSLHVLDLGEESLVPLTWTAFIPKHIKASKAHSFSFSKEHPIDPIEIQNYCDEISYKIDVIIELL